MKQLMIASLVCVLSTGTVSAAVLDFENFGTDLTPLNGDEFEETYGVTFFSTDGLRLVEVGGQTNGFAPNDTPDPADAFGSYFLNTNFDDNKTDLTITYTNAVDALSFDMGDTDGPEQFVFIVKDVLGLELDRKVLTAGDPGTGNQSVKRIGFSDLAGQIKTVEITGTGGPAGRRLGIAFDNFNTTTNTAPDAVGTIPVPTSAVCMATGTAVLLGMRRRRRASERVR